MGRPRSDEAQAAEEEEQKACPSPLLHPPSSEQVVGDPSMPVQEETLVQLGRLSQEEEESTTPKPVSEPFVEGEAARVGSQDGALLLLLRLLRGRTLPPPRLRGRSEEEEEENERGTRFGVEEEEEESGTERGVTWGAVVRGSGGVGVGGVVWIWSWRMRGR